MALYKASAPTSWLGKYSLGKHQTAKIIKLTESEYDAGTTYNINVRFFFFSCPTKEYTVSIYSKMGLDVKHNGATNMLHMDGQSPSGFQNSQYTGIQTCVPPATVTTNDQTTDDGVTPRNADQIAEVEVKSLLDVVEQSRSVSELFVFVIYNPWTLFIWFHFW